MNGWTRKLVMLGVCLLLARVSWADDIQKAMEAAKTKHGETICTVKLVIDIKFQGQAQEQPAQMTGTIVNETGLVVISNKDFDPAAMMGRPMPPGFNIEVTPKNFKITIGKEEKELDAFIVADDKKLGLSFLQIQALGERKLKFASFAGDAALAAGQKVILVDRLGQDFDYLLTARVSRVNGLVTKPRAGSLVYAFRESLGMPVYGIDGKVAGILIGVSGEGELSSGTLPIVLPAAVTRARIGQAAEIAKEMLEEEG